MKAGWLKRRGIGGSVTGEPELAGLGLDPVQERLGESPRYASRINKDLNLPLPLPETR